MPSMTWGDMKAHASANGWADSLVVNIVVADGGPESFSIPGYTFTPGHHTKPVEHFGATPDVS